LAKVIVVYDSLFGNTRMVAESIITGMKQALEVEATLNKPKELELNRLTKYDIILVGSPNHMGGATLSIQRFIGKLGKINLEGKLAAAFDTCGVKDFGKAVKKMEKQIRSKAPGLKLVAPGLSIKVKGLRGPIMDGELPRCEKFGVKVAKRLKKKA